MLHADRFVARSVPLMGLWGADNPLEALVIVLWECDAAKTGPAIEEVYYTQSATNMNPNHR